MGTLGNDFHRIESNTSLFMTTKSCSSLRRRDLFSNSGGINGAIFEARRHSIELQISPRYSTKVPDMMETVVYISVMFKTSSNHHHHPTNPVHPIPSHLSTKVPPGCHAPVQLQPHKNSPTTFMNPS
jgi:hypothetical protein